MPIEASAHCQVCADLQREHSAECKAETAARLRRASFTIAPRDGVRRVTYAEEQGAEWADLDSRILESRKRQAHLADRLSQHRESAHRNASAAGA